MQGRVDTELLAVHANFSLITELCASSTSNIAASQLVKVVVDHFSVFVKGNVGPKKVQHEHWTKLDDRQCTRTVAPTFFMAISTWSTIRPWQKKRALKFALKGSGSFKACFKLYRCLNPEKSFKSSFKNDFWAFFHDICSTMFWVAAWVQVEFRSLSSFWRRMLFDWLLLLLLCPKFTFSRDCVQGWWVRSSKVCFSAMADCISAKSHALNRALKCYKSFKTKL